MTTYPKNPTVYPVLILGDKGVGKTAILNRIVLNVFAKREDYDPTGQDNYRKQVLVDGEYGIVELSEIEGNEAYPGLHLRQLKASSCAMVIYSICSRSSFERVHAIYQEIMEGRGGDKGFPICLVGNRKDEIEWRVVSVEEGEELAEKLGCTFEECSAKDGTNVERAVHNLVRGVRQRQVDETVLQENKRRREDEEGGRKEAELKRKRNSLWRKLFRYVCTI